MDFPYGASLLTWKIPRLSSSGSKQSFFYLTRLINLLYDEAAGESTLLQTTLLPAGFGPPVWSHLVPSEDLPLASHWVAAYLRVIPLLSRLFFAVPPCRFCDHSWGNDHRHFSGCPVLYLRLQVGFRAVLRRLALHFSSQAQEGTDLFAHLCVGSSSIYL